MHYPARLNRPGPFLLLAPHTRQNKVTPDSADDADEKPETRKSKIGSLSRIFSSGFSASSAAEFVLVSTEGGAVISALNHYRFLSVVGFGPGSVSGVAPGVASAAGAGVASRTSITLSVMSVRPSE